MSALLGDMLVDEHSEMRTLRQSVRKFVDDHVIPHELELERHENLDPVLWEDLVTRSRALGIWALNYPEHAGGQGMDPLAQVVVREEMGRTTMGMSRLARRPPLALLSSTDYAREIALESVAGRAEVCFAMTESGAGSSVRTSRTRFEIDGGARTLHGEKHFVTAAPTATHMLVMGREGDSDKYTTALVPMDRDGVVVHARSKMGWRGWPWGDITLNAVDVADHELLGAPGDGLRVVMSDIEMTRLGVSAHYVGTTHRALELAVEQASLRQVSGGLLSDQQGFRWKVAGLSARLMVAHEAVVGVARSLHEGRRQRDGRISALKLLASELAFEAADFALQVSGALGFQTDTIENVLFRDARAFRIGEGTTEIQLESIARSVMGART